MDYWKKDFTVTGTQDAPQTVLFADLEDDAGNELPSTFASAPSVMVFNSNEDRGANRVKGSVNTTGFHLKLPEEYDEKNIMYNFMDEFVSGFMAEFTDICTAPRSSRIAYKKYCYSWFSVC